MAVNHLSSKTLVRLEMPRCEDYPCCGHGPAPLGDDGGCPDEDGRFDCVLCYSKLPKNSSSSICVSCRSGRMNWDEDVSPDGEPY